MPDHDSELLWREVNRLRDRQHDLGNELARLKWHVDDLREWRAKAAGQLDGIVKAEEIADAVADALHERRAMHFTVGQKIAGLALAVFMAIPSAEHLAGIIGRLFG